MSVRLSVLACLALLFLSCGNKVSDEMVPFMDGLPNRLVVVFRQGADPRGVFAFQEEHTLYRPEIGAIVAVGVEGHDAYEIGFYPSVTAEQIASIRAEMAASDLVYAIYENVDPEEIVLRPSADGS